MNLTPLHINTEFSFNESVIKIDDLINKAIQNKITSLVITDRNVMFGVSEFLHKTKKANIKPIIGIDLDVQEYRFILLAKNYEGYILLNNLSTKKMKNIQIDLKEIKSNNLIIIDHPTKGYYIKNKKPFIFEDNYFIGSEKDDFKNSVFLKENKFLEEEERESLGVWSKMVNKNINISDLSPLSFVEKNNNTNIENINKIINQCNIEFKNNDSILPKYKNCLNMSSIEYLKKIIKENAQKILLNKTNKEEYVKRTKYELSIIEKLKFEDYFLIIWDLINWSKNNNILIGPGRGSVSGSLIAYFLNITEVDPLEFDLIFERFLNPSRVTMPDIDIDIQDNRREEVINYLFDKYGQEKVALITTFSRLGPKSSIRDVARLMQIPIREVNQICKLIPNDLNLKETYEQKSSFRALIDSKDIFFKLFNWSKMIEGLPRQFSTHAAGVVISDKNLIKKSAFVIGADEHNQIQFPMDFLEENGLLKIDLLGLRNLTIIKNIQKEIYINYNKKVNLKNISYYDPLTNDLLTNANTNGVFQLESYGMKTTLKKIKVNSINDIVAILSLYRPGPMDNIQLYADIKNKKKQLKKIEKNYDTITKDTCGIIIYQEQIMQIAQKFANMSFAQSDILRRAIGKKNTKLLHSTKEDFINKSLKNNHSLNLSNNIFDIIEKFANYGFNKSHAVGYSIIAYRMAYLKAHFPFEFYTSLLNSYFNSKTVAQKYILECKKNKIQIITPNINKSEFDVVNKKQQIILPLQFIKGFGNIGAEKLLKERKKGEFKDFFNFISRAKKINLGDKNIEMLILSNSLRDFGNIETLIQTLPLASRYSKMVIFEKDNELFIDESIIEKPNLIICKKDLQSEIFNEKKYLGFQIHSFITKDYESKIKIENLKNQDKKELVFLVEDFRITQTKNNKEMAIIKASDSTKQIVLIVFDEILKKLNLQKGIIAKGLIECNLKEEKLRYTLKSIWKEM